MRIFTKELEAKLRKLRVYTEAKRIATIWRGDSDSITLPNYEGEVCISGCFMFSDTPQGHDYWWDIMEKTDRMFIPKKNVIGGTLFSNEVRSKVF